MNVVELLTTSGTTPKSSAATTTPVPETPLKDIKEAYSTLNSDLTSLYNALPPATAFILFTGHSDPRKMSELSKRKNRWDQLLREGTFGCALLFVATLTSRTTHRQPTRANSSRGVVDYGSRPAPRGRGGNGQAWSALRRAQAYVRRKKCRCYFNRLWCPHLCMWCISSRWCTSSSTPGNICDCLSATLSEHIQDIAL